MLPGLKKHQSWSERKKRAFERTLNNIHFSNKNNATLLVYYSPTKKGLITYRGEGVKKIFTNIPSLFLEEAKTMLEKSHMEPNELRESIPIMKDNINEFLTIDKKTNKLRLKLKYFKK